MSGSETPPRPDGVPILGNGLDFARDPIAAMESWSDLGDLVELRYLGGSMYLVTHPDLVERILVDEQHRFSIGPEQRETFAGIEDHAMTTATGDRWRRLRRAAHPAFTRERIQRYGDAMAAVTARFVDEWDDGERIDIQEEMQRLTVQILGETLLEEDLRGREDVVVDAADAFIDRTTFGRPGQLLPRWVPTPTERRFRRTVERLDAMVDDVVARRQAARESGSEHERAGAGEADAETHADDRFDAGNGREDVCSILLSAHEDGELTIEEVEDNLVAFLLAGHESPAGALTRAWYLLEGHPAVYEELRAEYDRVVSGDRPSGGAVEDLEFTRCVVAETLRLLPPTTGVNRQAIEPVTLGGYELPAGAQFMIPQWLPHRDERFWEEPETFDPDRWATDDDRPEFAYFPFGGGPRGCIGGDFARQELTLALATMVGRLDLDVTAEEPLSFVPSIQLRIDSEVSATVRRR